VSIARPSPIPDRPEAITPTWLGEALSTSLPGVEVARVEVVDRHSGTTGRARLRLEYASGRAGPETVFAKLAPFGERQRKLVATSDMGRREARFYAHLAGETPMRVPRVWFAAYGDEPTEYIMVLEDLEASGCRFTRDVENYARQYGRQVVENLARVHAHFWEDERFESELSWLRPPAQGPRGAKLVRQARELFSGELPPVFAELCRLYVEHHEAIADLWQEGPTTLIHGDIHSGNQFVDGDGVGFYDWAVIGRAPGIRDLGIFLCNSCPTEVRREEERSWLRVYRQGLLDHGVPAPEPEEIWRRYRRAALYGWVAATATAAVGDRWQPIEVGMTAMRRSTRNCAELETVEAFREVL